MNTNFFESCVSYTTCGIALGIQDINWMTVGAIVLLVARLITDIPEAYDSIHKRIRRTKQDKDTNKDGN